MDRADFLLERESLIRRMETHRLAAEAILAERQNGVIPRILRTGSEVLFGFGARGGSVGWISTLLWSLLAPALLGVVRQGGDALVHNLIQKVFPSGSSKSHS